MSKSPAKEGARLQPRVYSTASIPTPEEPTAETVTIHLRVDDCENSVTGSGVEFPVSAFEDHDIFVARPLEITTQLGTPLPADPPQYDPNDIHRKDRPPSSPVKTEQPSSYAKKVACLLKDFSEKNKVGEWPLSTSTLCHWCCHPFATAPIGVPVRYDGEYFYVTGCFCSFACAAANNQNSGENNTTILKRHSLLCTLASRLGCNEHIRVAPPRLSLSCFGGYLSIDEFRAFAEGDRVMIVNLPPMRAMAQQIEEVNEGDVGSGYSFIPIDHVRNERGLKTDLALKRAKPLLNLKNTLHNTMNVQVIPGE